MNTVLWHQRSAVNSDDIFIIDGLKQIAENSTEQVEAFSQLIKAREWPTPKLLSLFMKMQPQVSRQLQVFNGKEHRMMIQSHFVDKDDAGRLIPYMFLSNNDQEAIALLKEYAQQAGRTLNESDIKVVEQLLRFQKNKNTYVVSVIIILLVLILLFK